MYLCLQFQTIFQRCNWTLEHSGVHSAASVPALPRVQQWPGRLLSLSPLKHQHQGNTMVTPILLPYRSFQPTICPIHCLSPGSCHALALSLSGPHSECRSLLSLRSLILSLLGFWLLLIQRHISLTLPINTYPCIGI